MSDVTNFTAAGSAFVAIWANEADAANAKIKLNLNTILIELSPGSRPRGQCDVGSLRAGIADTDLPNSGFHALLDIERAERASRGPRSGLIFARNPSVGSTSTTEIDAFAMNVRPRSSVPIATGMSISVAPGSSVSQRARTSSPPPLHNAFPKKPGIAIAKAALIVRQGRGFRCFGQVVSFRADSQSRLHEG